MTAPRLAAQLQGRCDLTPDRGQTAWFWHAGGLDLVRCIQAVPVHSPAGPLRAWSVVLHGRCLIVPADRLTPVPDGEAERYVRSGA